MVDAKVGAHSSDASGAPGSVFERFPAHEASVGTLKIVRALPIRQKRLVGAWCFLDRFGPLSFSEAKPMDVAPHPHIGLQTVSWLLQGEIVHNDSLGSEALLRPGGVNVMTSGGGIAHAEETPRKNSGLLNGAQLWIALPDAYRNGQASFQHIDEVPIIEQAIDTAALMLGSDKSRGYCLEMICADFLAGANLDNGNPEILFQSMKRFFMFLTGEQKHAFLALVTQKAS